MTPTLPLVVLSNRTFPETRALFDGVARVDANPDDRPWPGAELRRRCREAVGLMAFMTDMIDEAFLADCPDLRVIGATLKGYDNIDVEAATAAGVIVTIVPDLLTQPTAELTVGLMLALGRHIVDGDRSIRENGFGGWRPTFYGAGLAGSTVGLVGFGRVGRAIARCLAGFGCRLIAWDEAAGEPEPGVTRAPLEAVLAAADHLVLCLPLTPSTEGLIDRAAIGRMKPGARLINPARGSLVDEVAIADAIEAGRLAGYAADVFQCEDWARPRRPRKIDPRLTRRGAPTVLTPHIGSAVTEIRRAIERAAAAGILDVLAGRTPEHAINSPRRTGSRHAQPEPRPHLSRGS